MARQGSKVDICAELKETCDRNQKRHMGSSIGGRVLDYQSFGESTSSIKALPDFALAPDHHPVRTAGERR